MASRKVRARIDASVAAIEKDLRDDLKAALPSRGQVTERGPMVKALRALGALQLTPTQYKRAREKIVAALSGVMGELKIDARDLGARDLDHLAELFMRMLERVRYSRYNISELRRKARGLRGVFTGELFELLVLNLTSLQQDLKNMAALQLESLNVVWAEEFAIATGAAASSSRAPRILNALGEPIPWMVPKGEFKGIDRVVDIFIYRDGKKLKFTDFGYISYYKDARGTTLAISFLVEGEIKLPRAAAGFSDQIGRSQGRFAGAERVEMVVQGQKTPISFRPEEIIFDRASINRNAITTTRATNDTYRWRTTNKGGYPEAYLRMGLTVNVDDLRRLVNILFRH